MKYYEKLISMGCFSRNDIEKLIGNNSTAGSLIYEYLRRGYIERVRRDLYVTISLETYQPIVSRYRIGSALFEDAVISHHSAFEMYGYANQVFNVVYVMTANRFIDFSYGGVTYHRVNPSYPEDNIQIIKTNTTSIEKTVIDSIEDLDKIAGLEETVRCIQMIPSLNERKLLTILEKRNNCFLWQKCGYILSEMNDTLLLTDSFFKQCKDHKAYTKRSLIQEPSYKQKWSQEWGLYVPLRFDDIWNKGVRI
ncbi:MAG: transcriptional regulator [Clostridia bacterium]|jgi:predicted transcriptional regulator of viral defense system|nr:transcriptional regulator [Clostridia bacterium]